MSEISISVRQLVTFLCNHGSIDSRFTGFDRAQEGARIHRKLQKEAGDGYSAEVYLKESFPLEDLIFCIDGRADGVFTDTDNSVVIDEIKTTALPSELITGHHNETHWAQAKVYAAIYAKQNLLEEIKVRLTYYQIDTEEIFRFYETFTLSELNAFLQNLLEEYAPWARKEISWQQQRTVSLQALDFPFSSYRPGQYAMAGAVYRACRDKNRLLAQAPTGIGKTISTIFPALKAMGNQFGDRIFYLTARNTQAAAVEQAVALLRRDDALRLKVLVLTAKDKICFSEKRECTPEVCPYANGYYDRVKDGLWEALEQEDFTRTNLENIARRHQLCPFEFGLDLSLWCDLIVGDYNYLFDPTVSLKRFFENGSDSLFLVDEAHNLPSRAREMHSALLQLSECTAARKALGRKKSKEKSALQKLEVLFDSFTELCADQPKHICFLPKPPIEFIKALMRAASLLQDWLDEHREGEAHDKVLDFYFSLRSFSRVYEVYDEHYTTQLYSSGKECSIRLLCLDPSAFIDYSLNLGRASVLFSATLSPLKYYQDLLGCTEAAVLSLPSPFEPQHLGVYRAVDLRTTFKEREKTLDAVCLYLAEMVDAHTGNYLACFPSYIYLRKAAERLKELRSDIPLLLQESGMAEADRAAFLEHFTESPQTSLLGFVVMGGLFGEGIDLVGNRLIGAAIIGVGLPQVNPVQEKLREYFEACYENGFRYAYQYPGMNKVQQAAGRVIRTEQDKGVILLLDERFGWTQYAELFPAHWSGCVTLHSIQQFRSQLKTFWQHQ